METASSVAQLLGLSPERVDDLRTAVSEACLNAMQHGNHFSPRQFVKVTFRVQNDSLQVDIRDAGEGLENWPQPPNLERKLAGEEPSRGWGVFLIEHLVDKVEFKRMKNRGHITRLTLYLSTLDAPA